MPAFVTSYEPISAKLLMLPEPVWQNSAMDLSTFAMDFSTSMLAVVGGPAGAELTSSFVAFSFFQASLLPYMAFVCFIGWVGRRTPSSIFLRLQFIPLFVLSCCFTGIVIKSARQRVKLAAGGEA